jgi:hypothetical protein
MYKIKKCTLKSNGTAFILNNGSERGDFIDCEKILWSMGRIHDGIQMMKTYYPSDPSWTTEGKISKFSNKESVSFAWGHDYDDYEPYDIHEPASKTRKQLEQVKQFGADVHLTLTMDMSLSELELERVFEPLKNFGKVYLRINHEANGYWFRHNTLHSYKEVSDFFVTCHKIIKRISSNIYTVFNVSADAFVGDGINNAVTNKDAHLEEHELLEAVKIADYWSIDKYVTLNWGWPHTHPDSSPDYFEGTIDTWWRLVEECYLLMASMNGGQCKPLFIGEFNTDSDVVGEQGQVDTIKDVYKRIRLSRYPWLKGISMYQYCDEGGLGLNKGNQYGYQETPALAAYRTEIHETDYICDLDEQEWDRSSFSFSWKDIDSIKGLKVELDGAGSANFKNRWITPVYVKIGSSWHYLRHNQHLKINASEFFLFVPPHKKAHCDNIEYVQTVKNIKGQLASMIVVESAQVEVVEGVVA